jgi:sugar lactone lactonase YvrE
MKNVLLFLLVLALIVAIVARVRYGGGEVYDDLTGTPVVDASLLEEVLAYPEPIGNVAVSSTGRVFFTVHPEARPTGNKVLEFVDGAAVPYPSIRQQAELFDTPLGIAVDRYNRLWTIDHGNHGLRSAKIVGIDLATGEVIRQHALPADIAPAGSFLQDLQVSADGNTIVIADASFWRKRPAIIVYDVETGAARRVLESHASVSAEDYVIRNGGREMTFFKGLVALRGGIDGIALGPEWLYFGALSGSELYRVRLRDLRDGDLSQSQMAKRVESYSIKPLSDGLSIDVDGNVYITDVEHHAIFVVDGDRDLVTLLQSENIRWPDALSFGPDGWLYVADSALGDVVLRSKEHIASQAPYRVFRFQPGAEGTPGQ